MTYPSAAAAIERYNPVARALHWMVAVLVLVVLPFGAVIKFVKEDVKLTFYMFHESLGFLILWLMLARLAVRLLFPPPPELPIPAVFSVTARIVHSALYAALIAQPIAGFLATNAFGFPLQWFYLFEVWSPVGRDQELGRMFMAVHVVLGYSILVLFLLHIGGVLFHHVLRRDPILYRMV